MTSGRALTVLRSARKLVFDWPAASENSDERSGEQAIKWVAFYNDCEHEVHEATSGHRLILTYNLYLTGGGSHPAGAAPMLDPTLLPLHAGSEQALKALVCFRHGMASNTSKVDTGSLHVLQVGYWLHG